MTQPEMTPLITLEERKRKLLAEGALFRVGIMQARGVVSANMSAESLARNMLGRVAGTLSSAFHGTFSGKGSNLQSLSPLLISGLSLLARRSMRKPVLYGAIISASAVGAYYLARRRKRPQQTTEADDTPTPGDM